MVPLYAARLAAGRTRGDGGFSLAETMVALGIAVVSLLGLLGTSVFAVKATVGARQAQQAGDVMNAAIEELRSLEFGALRMLKSNVAATVDPGRTGAGTTASPYEVEVNPETGAREQLDVGDTAGSVNPYVETETVEGVRYTVKRYVTLPEKADGTPDYVVNDSGLPSVRRVTVRVEWRDRQGALRERTVGTLMTQTRRGLPLPHYTFTYNGPAPVVADVPTWTLNPGNRVEYGFVLTNRGATDSWLISADAGTWDFHVDLNHDGLLDSGEPELGDGPTAASSTCDCWTGTVAAGSDPVYLVAVRTLGLTEVVGSSTTTFSATSVAQPSHPPKTVTTGLVITTGAVTPPTESPSATPTATATASPSAGVPCTPGTATTVTNGVSAVANRGSHSQSRLVPLALHNGTTRGDTATEAISTMNEDTARLPGPCNYSTDRQTSRAGRLLDGTGSGTNGRAEWHFQAPSSKHDVYEGTAVLRLWVQCPTSSPSLEVQIGKAYGSGFTSFTQFGSNTGNNGRVTVATCSSTGFWQVDVPYSLGGDHAINRTSERLAVRVTSNAAVRLLYDTDTAPGVFEIGMR